MSAGSPDSVRPRLPGGFNLPPFGIHQMLALIIVCIALWALGAMWLTMQAAGQWAGGWQQEIRMHVYIDPGKQVESKKLGRALAAIDQVASVRRISAQEAASWMSNWLKGVGLNQKELAQRLPITFELALEKDQPGFLFADIRDVAERYGASINEDEINLAQVHHWLTQAGYLAWFASLVMALAMALIISNTLRMLLLARIDEIHLMRLMGAREWFVRMPFILEGVLLGAGAGIAAWLLLWPLVWATDEWFATLQIDLGIWRLLLPLMFGGGLVGGLGAMIATARATLADASA